MKKLLSIGLLLLAGFCRAETGAVVGPFSGLNDSDNPLILGQNQAQSILNVQISPGGKSIYKRRGFGLSFNTSFTTSPIHGVYAFYDASGNEVALAFNDTRLTASVNGAAATVLFTTQTFNATWQCTDSLGFAYCASSGRDPLIKTNGVTYNQISMQTMASTGTMVAATTQRLATAGFSLTPSQINFSKANDFATWATGPLATDGYSETINAPGSRITHITFACGNLIWFKDASFGMIINPDDQFNAQDVTVSPTLGTLDNSSVYYNGILHFRAQDGHFYDFDCSSLQKMTRDIQNTVSASGSRRSNSWTQTSQSDWQSGTILPTGQLSTTISVGDVTNSSFTVTENSAATGWSSGSNSNFAVGTSSLSLKTNNSGNIADNSFESSSDPNFSANFTVQDNSACLGSCVAATTPIPGHCTETPKSGTYFARLRYSPASGDLQVTAEILASDASTILATTAVPYAGNTCSYVQKTISSSGYIGRRVYLRFRDTGSGSGNYFRTANSFILGGDITFWTESMESGASNTHNIIIDLIEGGSSTITTGSFTSQIFNTGLTSATYSLSNFAWTANTSTPTFALLTSTANPTNSWVTTLTSSGTNAVGNKYARYVATITVTAADSALTSITNATIIARSSGTIYSAVRNAPSLTSWDTFAATKQDNDGTHAFYVRSSSNSFSVLSSTPAWTAQTNNSQVVVTTYTYFQMRDDFGITAATNTPILSDFTFSWFEGVATDKVYGIYFNNAIWWAVQKGTAAVANNYVLRYELENNGWTLFDIPANGFYVRGNSLYFGSSVYGKVYKFGDVDSDDNTAINSYWKSKDFFGADPFTENEYRKISVSAKTVANSSMTLTYTTDASSSTSYTIPLYTSLSAFIKNNRNLPASRNGSYLNIQVGNNAADQRWEVFGIGYTYEPKPWRPGN